MPERGRCFSIGKTTLSWPVAVDVERFVAAVKNSVQEKNRMRNVTHRGMWLELVQVASDSATLGLGLGNRKVRSQVIGVDQCRLPGRRAVEKVRTEGR